MPENDETTSRNPLSMADYANQVMAERADAVKNQYENVNKELLNATPKYKGTSSGVSTWDNFNPATKSGKDPLTPEQRQKLAVFESYVGQMPALYEPLKWSEAEAISRFRIDPQYEQSLNETLKAQNRAAVKSGFFGQLPAEQLRQNAMAAEEANRQQAIFGGALDLMAKDDASKYARYGLEYQGYRDMMNDIARSLGIVTDAFDTDWNRNYQSWQEDFNQWYSKQQLALAQQAAARGSGGDIVPPPPPPPVPVGYDPNYLNSNMQGPGGISYPGDVALGYSRPYGTAGTLSSAQQTQLANQLAGKPAAATMPVNVSQYYAPAQPQPANTSVLSSRYFKYK